MISPDTLIQNNKQSLLNKENFEFVQSNTAYSLHSVDRDLKWFKEYVTGIVYLKLYEKGTDQETKQISDQSKQMTDLANVPDINTDEIYDKFLLDNKVTIEERIVILTSIAPYFNAGLLKMLNYEDSSINSPFLEFGGKKLANNELIPTIDTIRFLIAKGNLIQSCYVDALLKENGKLLKHNVIQLHNHDGNIYWNKQIVKPTEEFLAYIKGEEYEPSFNSNFPASKITTRLNWDDLILPYDTLQELKEVNIWLKHKDRMMQHKQLSRVIKPGFRCLFYGPPGTGKTLTAALLGKSMNMEVYRVDLSMVVSKWVGETEKNLKGIFDQAQNKNWILFFDEADSLFGKRTQTKSSNDRHANQEVAYLLQRIEDFPGLVLLATNLKDNIDEAFSRRFQSMVYFPVPDAETRLTLWKNTFPEDFKLEACIDMQKIADNHEIAGGIIVNVVRYCVLMALDRDSKIITEEDLETGIMKELRKSGKVV